MTLMGHDFRKAHEWGGSVGKIWAEPLARGRVPHSVMAAGCDLRWQQQLGAWWAEVLSVVGSTWHL